MPDSVTMLAFAVFVVANLVCASLNQALLVSDANCSLLSDVAGALHTKLLDVASLLSNIPLPLVSSPVCVCYSAVNTLLRPDSNYVIDS
nr:hypothetical protein [Pseudoalteromonas sp. WY3]